MVILELSFRELMVFSDLVIKRRERTNPMQLEAE
jgi:hypothetical protein